MIQELQLKNSLELFEAANNPKELWIAPDSEHENIYEKNTEIYKLKVKEFLDKYFLGL